MPSASEAYTRHALHFLRRAGKLEHEFESDPVDSGAVQSELDLIWDQVLSAANWSRSHSQESRFASILYAGFVSLNGTIAQLRLPLKERKDWLVEALSLKPICEQKVLLCTLLCQLGNVYTDLGHLPQAVEVYKTANSLALDIDEQKAKVSILSNLGNAYRRLGEYSSATSCLEQAARGCKDLGERRHLCAVLLNLGHSHFQRGNIERASEHFGEACDLARSTGDVLLETNAVGSIGSTYLSNQKFATALPFLQDALRLARSVGNRRDESLSLNDIAIAYMELGDHEKAIALATEALEVGRISGELRCQAVAFGTLGNTHLYRQDLPLAVIALRKSLSLARAMQDPALEGKNLANLSQALYEHGSREEAISHLTSAVNLLETLGDQMAPSLRTRLHRWLEET